jgi:hypothetical protein
MTELNRLIGSTLNKHKEDLKEAVKVFFQLLGTEPEENHDSLKTAIVYSLESLHDWTNILKYAVKWNMT